MLAVCDTRGFPARSCLLGDYGADLLTVVAASSPPCCRGALLLAVCDTRGLPDFCRANWRPSYRRRAQTLCWLA